jgi:hypothetical protein
VLLLCVARIGLQNHAERQDGRKGAAELLTVERSVAIALGVEGIEEDGSGFARFDTA